MTRRPVQIASVATIALSATFLLLRMHVHRHQAMASARPALLASADALPNARVSDDAPVPRQNPPSPAWTVAFEKRGYSRGKRRSGLCIRATKIRHFCLKDAGEPCWSPDRKQIAFERAGNVWVAAADGSAQRQLTFWPANQKDSSHWAVEINGISWNQEGQFLSFGRCETFGLTLPDGHGKSVTGSTIFHVSLVDTRDRPSKRYPFHQPMHLIPNDFNDSTDYAAEKYPPSFDFAENRTPFRYSDCEFPAWSVSGRKLAFVRNGDIWIADRSGINQTSGSPAMWTVKRIAACAEHDGTTGCGDHWTVGGTSLSWAPDESYLVYGAGRITGSGQEDLHLLRLAPTDNDDSDWHRRYVDTALAGYGSDLCVSLDGKWILYAGRSPGPDKEGYQQETRGIWAETLDGKQAQLITKVGASAGDGYYTHPVW